MGAKTTSTLHRESLISIDSVNIEKLPDWQKRVVRRGNAFFLIIRSWALYIKNELSDV